MINTIDETALTPLMRQYVDIKREYNETLVLFQVGDFYELFFDDAKTAARFLGIALTKRGTYNGSPIPLCGVPVHALEHYLTKLVKGGFKIVLCDQLEEARSGIIVRRGVTRVITPGTRTDTALLDAQAPSYLLTFVPTQQEWGLLFAEVLTGRLFGTTLGSNEDKRLDTELARFMPDEVILPATDLSLRSFFTQRGYFSSVIHPVVSDDTSSLDAWVQARTTQCNTNHAPLRGTLHTALAYLYQFMEKHQQQALANFTSLNLYTPEDFLILDRIAMRNLEILNNSHDGTRSQTVLAAIDKTVTSMGSRTTRKWLSCPLLHRHAIEERHDAVDVLIQHHQTTTIMREQLSQIGDLERLVGRLALNRATVTDYTTLYQVLMAIPPIRNLLQQYTNSNKLDAICNHMQDFSELTQLLDDALNRDTTVPYTIRHGYDALLDECRACIQEAHAKIATLEEQEQRTTGIASLKIRYNQVHGYAIEITKANLHAVPAHYVRQQTLVGKERYTMPLLQEFEDVLRHAEQTIQTREEELFNQIKLAVTHYIHQLRAVAYALSYLDALAGFATIAQERQYTRPIMHDGTDMSIVDGRHPVVEQSLGHTYIPNSTELTTEQTIWLVTGPNMGGKSTFLRQTALISIMAQAGCFVPATAAKLPILDRIFTRIGAADNVANGKSTFLVEMEETAIVCTEATARSLVILDEVGRGTSTFDGLALAQAIVEYIATKIHAKCLFATHYHELTTLAQQYPTIKNYHAASQRTKTGILLLHKINPGIADGSFGIEAARLAALPDEILTRAYAILSDLEQHKHPYVQQALSPVKDAQACVLHQSDDSVVTCAVCREYGKEHATHKYIAATIAALDFDNLSPRAAFDVLWELKRELG